MDPGLPQVHDGACSTGAGKASTNSEMTFLPGIILVLCGQIRTCQKEHLIRRVLWHGIVPLNAHLALPIFLHRGVIYGFSLDDVS